MLRANFRAESVFRAPKELKAIIAARNDDFSRNLVERLLAYALCRQLEGYDEIVVDRFDGGDRRGWVPHADAHHASRDQLSFHASSNPEEQRTLQ